MTAASATASPDQPTSRPAEPPPRARRHAGRRGRGPTNGLPVPTAGPNLEPGTAIEAFLTTVILGDHLPRLPEAEREPFARAVATRMPEPVIDYVRLNIGARRAGTMS